MTFESTWIDSEIAQLKRLNAEGNSASLIGIELGKTRNSVIGKLHRLGLSSKPTKRIKPAKRRPSTVHIG